MIVFGLFFKRGVIKYFFKGGVFIYLLINLVNFLWIFGIKWCCFMMLLFKMIIFGVNNKVVLYVVCVK